MAQDTDRHEDVSSSRGQSRPPVNWVLLVPAVILLLALLYRIRDIWHPLVLFFAFAFFCFPWRSNQWIGRAIVTAGMLVAVWLLRLVSDVLTPLLVALALAFVFSPVVDWLCGRSGRWKPFSFGRGFASLLVTLLLFGALVAIGAQTGKMLVSQADQLAALVGNAGEIVRSAFPASWSGSEVLGSVVDSLVAAVEGIGQSIPDLTRLITEGADVVARGALAFLLTLIFFFYALKDFHWLTSTFSARYLPVTVKGFVDSRTENFNRTLRGFIVGYIISSTVVFGLTLGLLMLCGVKMAFLLALLAGALNIIPIVGFWLSTILTLVVALAGGMAPGGVLLMGLGLGVINQFDSNVIQPRVIGRRVGLHPVAAILSVGIFGKILGLPGVLLGIPLAALLTREWERVVQKASEEKLV
jgi:predicted PurR-regulated permease PerM